MDADGVEFVEAAVAAGASSDLALTAEAFTSFLAEMAQRGVVSLELGLKLSLLAATWLYDRQKERS